jgi:hypothetical protein
VIGVSRSNLVERLQERPQSRIGRPPLPDGELALIGEWPTDPQEKGLLWADWLQPSSCYVASRRSKLLRLNVYQLDTRSGVEHSPKKRRHCLNLAMRRVFRRRLLTL